MTKEKFHTEFTAAAEAAEKHHSVRDICKYLFIGRSIYYRWRKGKNAPIVIARYAAVEILLGLIP